MSNAKPCIVCGAVKRNVTDDSVNQPVDGLYFRTHGMYGSTVFDPMDGSFLEIIVCDDCVSKAREKDLIMWGRDEKPVMWDGTVVGACKSPNRPLLDWNNQPSALDDPNPANDILVVHDDDLQSPERFPEIRWFVDPKALLKSAGYDV